MTSFSIPFWEYWCFIVAYLWLAGLILWTAFH